MNHWITTPEPRTWLKKACKPRRSGPTCVRKDRQQAVMIRFSYTLVHGHYQQWTMVQLQAWFKHSDACWPTVLGNGTDLIVHLMMHMRMKSKLNISRTHEKPMKESPPEKDQGTTRNCPTTRVSTWLPHAPIRTLHVRLKSEQLHTPHCLSPAGLALLLSRLRLRHLWRPRGTMKCPYAL